MDDDTDLQTSALPRDSLASALMGFDWSHLENVALLRWGKQNQLPTSLEGVDFGHVTILRKHVQQGVDVGPTPLLAR